LGELLKAERIASNTDRLSTLKPDLGNASVGKVGIQKLLIKGQVSSFFISGTGIFSSKTFIYAAF
jgi:hypothetical protein